jgi:hypothetical protein
MTISIDQNCASFWDTIPKLDALRRKGIDVSHYVEDVDIAFAARGAEVDQPDLRLAMEKVYPGGGQDWGAGLFYSDFLGRLPRDPRSFEKYLGIGLKQFVKHTDVSLDAIYDQYGGGDTWMLIGSNFVGDRDHYRLLGDLSVMECIPFLLCILGLARQNCIERFSSLDARSRTRAWFSLEEERLQELIIEAGADSLADLYIAWLRKHSPANTHTKISTTRNLFSFDHNPAAIEVLQAFTKDYPLACELYNTAVAETEVGVRPLDTDAGELPFYAITHHHGHLVRTGCHLEDGLLRIQGRTYRLGPEGQLPVDALHKAGIEGLVGKAIVLVTQVRAGDKGRPLALPHQGSLYMPAAHQLTRGLLDNGLLDQPIHPIQRVRFYLLDRMSNLTTTIGLPDHLSAAYGTDELTAHHFSATYRDVIQSSRDRLDELSDDTQRKAWIDREYPKVSRAINRLIERKRTLAAENPKAPELRELGAQLRAMRSTILTQLMRQVSNDLQTLEMEYWDSRGGILPWCMSLGGQEFYDLVIDQAEILAETHEIP